MSTVNDAGTWGTWTLQPDGSSLHQFLDDQSNNAKFSPDGQWLFFQALVADHWHIFRSAVNGSATFDSLPDVALGVDTYGYNFAAHPLPGMPAVTFTSLTNGVGAVGVMDLNGANARICNPTLGYHYMSSLSPNGNEVVFSHTQENYILKRMNPDGTNVVTLAPDLPRSYVGQYTPDGQTLVYVEEAPDLTGNGDLYSVDRNGSNLKRLTNGNNYVGTYGTEMPSISPDGQKIAYVSKATGIAQVWMMNIDGTDQHQLTNLGGCNRVLWSPDGGTLAFASRDDTGHSQLFLMDPDGGSVRQLTFFADRSINVISWSSITQVPEPGTLTLLIVGSLALAGWGVMQRFSPRRTRG